MPAPSLKRNGRAHEELNAARASSHCRLVQAAFRWVDEAHELERLHQEPAT